jgi:hypothetical protein
LVVCDYLLPGDTPQHAVARCAELLNVQSTPTQHVVYADSPAAAGEVSKATAKAKAAGQDMACVGMAAAVLTAWVLALGMGYLKM